MKGILQGPNFVSIMSKKGFVVQRQTALCIAKRMPNKFRMTAASQNCVASTMRFWAQHTIPRDPHRQNLAYYKEYQAHLGWVFHPLTELLQYMIYASLSTMTS
jgi:hypothetical protein